MSGKWVDLSKIAPARCEDPYLFLPSSWEENRDRAWENKPPCMPINPVPLEVQESERAKAALMAEFLSEVKEKHKKNTLNSMAKGMASVRGLEMAEQEMEARAAGISAKMRILLFGQPIIAKALIHRRKSSR